MAAFLYLFGIFVLISCLIGIFLIHKSEIVLTVSYKIGMCDNDIVDKLKNMEDLILRCINIINRQIKLEIKIFDEVKNLKVSKLNNYEKDKVLSSAFYQIKKIYDDNLKLKDVKSFDGIIRDIDKLEIEMISLRTYYNKYASEFNNLYHKFPYNLICKLKKLKAKGLYEGKELNEAKKELDLVI